MQLTDKPNPNYPKSSTDFSNQSKCDKTQMLSPKFIQALTPIFIALIGASIGIICIFAEIESTDRSQAMGLASTAIAGAAGLAQSKEEK